MRSWDPPAVETRKHLLTDPQKSRPILGGFFVFIENHLNRLRNYPIRITIKDFLSLYKKEDLPKILEEKIDGTIMEIQKYFPQSAKNIENKVFEKSYSILR